MARARWGLRSLLAGLAAIGIVVAHALAYFLAAPDASLRDTLMAMTGHESWSLVIGAAAGVLTFGLSGFVISSATSPGRVAPITYDAALLRLAGMQAIGFLSLEAAERALEGGVGNLIGEPVVIIGLLIQVVIAVVGAVLLVGVAWAVDTLLRRSRVPMRKRAGLIPRPHLAILPCRIRPAADTATPRGPPILI